MPFKITISPQLSNKTITATLPPYFDPKLETEVQIYVGDPWYYKLPPSFDPQDELITTVVELGSASFFVEYTNFQFVI